MPLTLLPKPTCDEHLRLNQLRLHVLQAWQQQVQQQQVQQQQLQQQRQQQQQEQQHYELQRQAVRGGTPSLLNRQGLPLGYPGSQHAALGRAGDANQGLRSPPNPNLLSPTQFMRSPVSPGNSICYRNPFAFLNPSTPSIRNEAVPPYMAPQGAMI